MMLASRVIPCLDVDAGRVVKGVRFQDLRDAGDPAAHAARYEEQGADEIVILDISATVESRGNATATTRDVRRVLSIPLTVGGGVRNTEDAHSLLEAGADKVAVNTAAVARPALIGEIAARFGSQCTVLAVDAVGRDGGTWEVVVDGGRARAGIDAIEWIAAAASFGAGEILLTSWDRDGTRSGYDTDLLSAATAAVSVPVIASGGAADAQHLADAIDAGASAVLIASILHDNDTTVASLKRQLRSNGFEVRL